MTRSSEIPAILGGIPVRPQGLPEWPRRDESINQALQSLIRSGDWGRYHGSHLPEMCRRLADFHGVEHVLATSSGTSAVELALRGVGVQSGDEVITAAYDFKSNFQNILYLNALPVLVDLDPVSWQMNLRDLASAVTNRTRAILVSHLHGGYVPVDRMREIIGDRPIAIVEDACQSTGAIFESKRAGTWGDVGIISFGGSKLVTSGRGGAVLTRKLEIAERIKRQAFRGNDAYPLSELQAAVISPQLDRLDELNELRRTVVQRLVVLMGGFFPPLQFPTEQILPAYYKLGLKYVPERLSGMPRERFVQAMRAEGIPMDAGFRSNHQIHASRRFRAVGSLEEANQADARMITVYHPQFLEDNAAEQVMLAIEKIRNHAEEIRDLNV